MPSWLSMVKRCSYYSVQYTMRNTLGDAPFPPKAAHLLPATPDASRACCTGCTVYGQMSERVDKALATTGEDDVGMRALVSSLSKCCYEETSDCQPDLFDKNSQNSKKISSMARNS